MSGPGRPGAAPAPRRGALLDGGLALGALAALHRVSSHRAIDRLIRGRTWIFIVTFALIGIVTLQLGLLKLNAGIGRSLERGALLQTQNAALSVENSELAAGNRVEATAARLGMELVPPGSLKFLSAGGHGDLTQAAAALATPPHAVGSGESSSEAPASGESSSEQPASSESSTGSEASASAAQSSEGSAGEAGPPAESTSASGETGATQTTPAASSPPSSTGSGAGAPAGEETRAGGGEAAPGGGTQSGPAG